MKHFPLCLFLPVLLLCSAHSAYSKDLIAIVSAYKGEIESVRKIIDDEVVSHVETINGIDFTFASVDGKDVVFFMTNVSTVNAAMVTQLAITKFDIDLLLFSGVAGGLSPELKKGDLSIPEKWGYHAQGAYFNPDFPPELGQFVGIEDIDAGNFGMFYPAPVSASREGQSKRVKKPFFYADPDLLTIARAATKDLKIDNAHGEEATIKVGGLGLTGPVFMDNRDYRKWLHEKWGADCVEMEGTAVGQVCWANNVPFLIVRAMSDLAGGQVGKNEIDEFAGAAEDNSAKVIRAILKKL